MLLGTVQINGERLTSIEVDDLCCSISSNTVRLLSLRECQVEERDFKKLMKAVGISKSLLQLNLSLGVVNLHRAEITSKGIYKNRSLTSLLLHGSPIQDRGAVVLSRAIMTHPNIVSLDLGDCSITNAAIPYIADLLPHNGAKRGLQDLTLSANHGITIEGWTKLFVAVAASSHLKTLCLDYNKLGDHGASCIAVALPTLCSLELLDLEGCGITQYGANVLLYTIQNFPVNLKQLVLLENGIKKEMMMAIHSCLIESDDSDAESASVAGTCVSDTDISTRASSMVAGQIISKETIAARNAAFDSDSQFSVGSYGSEAAVLQDVQNLHISDLTQAD